VNNTPEDRIKQLTANLESIFRFVARESRPCRACGVQLWFVEHQNGRIAPYEYDGTNHFGKCPEAARFKRK
jgi:hypothetical protein